MIDDTIEVRDNVLNTQDYSDLVALISKSRNFKWSRSRCLPDGNFADEVKYNLQFTHMFYSNGSHGSSESTVCEFYSFIMPLLQIMDIDVLIKTPRVKNTSIYDIFIEDLKKKGYVVETLSHGAKKFMGICRYKNEFRRIDIMFTRTHDYPFAILYFTGSKEFNTRMRSYLLERGLSLNEYGIRDVKTDRLIDYTFLNERSIFDYIRWRYVEPENR